MAYPIRIFDFQSEEGRTEGKKFLHDLDKTMTALCGKIQSDEKLRKFHKFNTEELPEYMKSIAERAVKDVVKQLPEGELKWKGTLGLYGRKQGSVIKREKGLFYRIVINMGDPEIYYVEGEGLNKEPVVLPNGYALLCSPSMIDKVDLKVRKEPHRKKLDPKLKGIIPVIRSRNYIRSTIVLDLPLGGLRFPTKKPETEGSIDRNRSEDEN